MFVLTLEWFGLPDAHKRHGIQLEYGFKGKSNDELRQDWMGEVVPFMDELGIEVPAHYDDERGAGRSTAPSRARFDEEAKRWLLDEGPSPGTRSMTRWKARGPMNETYVGEAAARLPDHELREQARSEAAATAPGRRGRAASGARCATSRTPRSRSPSSAWG